MYTIANIRPFGHNVGNAAISFAMKNMIHDTFGRLVSFVEYPATRKYDSSKAGLTPQVVHEINRFADGVIIGGGNLFENNEIDIDSVALKNLQPPIMLFSNSRGRIYDRYGRLTERTDVIPDQKLISLIEKADISLSRDSATSNFISKLGDFSNDDVGYCPTINTGKYTSLLPTLPEKESVGVLISVRSPSLMNIPYRLQNRITSDIEDCIDLLRSEGYKRIRLLCNDSRDLDFANSFRFSKKVDTVFTSDVYLYLAMLKQAELVVSYRLHATLPSISMSTPTVNISYDERAICLFNDLQLNDHHINLVETGDNFMHELKKRVEDSNGIYKDYSTILKEWKNFSDIQFESLQNFESLIKKYLQDGRKYN